MIDDDSDDIEFDSGDESNTSANANTRLLQQVEGDDISDEEFEEQLEDILAYSTVVHEEVEANNKRRDKWTYKRIDWKDHIEQLVFL